MERPSDSRVRNPSVERWALAAGAGTVTTIVWSHGLLALSGASPVVGAWAITLAAVTVAAAQAATTWLGRRNLGRAAGIPVAVVLSALGAWPAALALLASSVAAALLAERLSQHLPRFAGTLGRRRWLRALWLASVLLAVVQVGRLTTHLAEPESSSWFLSTNNPFWADHECLPAYVYGAELALRGDPNVYDAAHYPGLDPSATPQTRMVGMVVEDPFQYAPQFLLWPALAVSLTHDYPTIRLGWFALQITFFLLVASLLAAFAGGQAGRVGALLVPLALSAFPMLHALQYGQFHLAAIGLALAAMLAFERKRAALGGAMLAIAVLSKLFPGLLLIVLLVQRRYRALAWTAAFGTILTAATLVVFGTAPFEAFFHYHLPRLQSGQAFAFGEAWPELREIVIADNQGVFGLVTKLAELGVPAMSESAAVWANRAFLVTIVVSTVWVARALPRADRADRTVAWMAIVGLGSLVSTGAFGDYVPLTAAWLATLVAFRLSTDRRLAMWLVPAWAFSYFIVGTSPVGDWFVAAPMMVLSGAGVVLMLVLFAHGLKRAAATEEAPAPRKLPAMAGRASSPPA